VSTRDAIFLKRFSGEGDDPDNGWLEKSNMKIQMHRFWCRVPGFRAEK
jgi:hypothetical protein